DEDQEVPGDRIGLERDSGEVGAADGVDPILARGEVGPPDRPPAGNVDGDVAKVADGDGDDLAEPQRDDGQVIATNPKSRRADDRAEQRRHCGGDPEGKTESPN